MNSFRYRFSTANLALIVAFVLAFAQLNTCYSQTNRRANNAASTRTSANQAQNPTPNAQARPAARPAAQTTAQSANAQPQVAANVPQKNNEGQDLTPEENAMYKEAMDLFNRQDLQGALQKLRELTNGNPAARPPRVIAALWFAQLKNNEAARIMLESATEEDPEDPEAYLSLADVSLREGELTAAELLTQKGIEKLANYSANAERKRSMESKASSLTIAYLVARRRWRDALVAINAKIKAEGETIDLNRARANALFQLEQYDQARQAFARAEQLNEGKGLPADAAMSQLYAAKGDMANAKKSLDAALQANPKSSPVLLLSISNALAENNLDAAWKLAQQLYKEDKSPDVLKTYGRVALFRSDYRLAEAAFQEAVRQSPLDSDASNGLALALCEQGDAEKNKRALQYATGNVQKQRNNRDFLATLGWVLYRSGQQEGAITALQQSAADGQINAASAYYFAVILSEKGQTEQAKNFLQAALASKAPFAKRAEATALYEKIK